MNLNDGRFVNFDCDELLSTRSCDRGGKVVCWRFRQLRLVRLCTASLCFSIVAGWGIMLAEGPSVTKPQSPVKRKAIEQPKNVDGQISADIKNRDSKKDEAQESSRPPKVAKTDAEWKKLLKPEQFRVTRLKETEQPFSGKYWHNKKGGKYACICCGEELYSSVEKFDSGTGWPSFWAPVSEHAISTEIDNSLETVRTEVHCDRCGSHLGHVFDDGPPPTGMRHCINSASLKFIPSENTKSK